MHILIKHSNCWYRLIECVLIEVIQYSQLKNSLETLIYLFWGGGGMMEGEEETVSVLANLRTPL